MTDVAIVGTLAGRREFLFAKPGRYVASGALWVEIETALAYGEVVRIGVEPSSEDRPVSVDDPETLAAVIAAVPGFEADVPPGASSAGPVAVY